MLQISPDSIIGHFAFGNVLAIKVSVCVYVCLFVCLYVCVLGYTIIMYASAHSG